MIPLVAEMVGKTLAGRYRLVRILGGGGIGHVLEAEQIGLDRRVAVKILRFVDERGLARFRQEARVAASLRHPNVVSILDFQTNPGEPAFLVMELLEGESLADLGKREAPLAPARAVRIALQLLSGLAAVHAAGLVHRDVKPGNVWIAKTLAGEVVKVLDFGLVHAPDARLTSTGEIVGTPSFFAPEQLRGAPADARADLHAVGAVLYVMMTGKLPWRGGEQLPVDILETIPAPLADVVPGVPRGLSDVVARALAKDPAARYPSAAEMVRALEPYAVDSPPADTIVQRPRRARERAEPRAGLPRALVVTMLGTAMLAAIVGALAWARIGRSEAKAVADASADVVAIADAAASSEADAVVAPPVDDASVTTPKHAEALRFARASDRYVCECVADVSAGNRGFLRDVCPLPPTPTCHCFTPDQSFVLCEGSWRAGGCKDVPSRYHVADEKKPCTGFREDGDAFEGVVACDHCFRRHAYYVNAPNGAACRGVYFDGLSFSGTWQCHAR